MKSSLTIIVLLLLLETVVSGQSAYYRSENRTVSGIQIQDNGQRNNSSYCYIKTGTGFQKFTPDEISEYKLSNGTRYISKEINIDGEPRKVFLEILVDRDNKLYYYKGNGISTFFIEKPHEDLIELPKRNAGNQKQGYSDYLLYITDDCETLSTDISKVKYTKKSLSTIMESYNSCITGLFPEEVPKSNLNFGFQTGIGIIKLKPKRNSSNFPSEFDYHYENMVSIGLFLSTPLKSERFILKTDLYYFQRQYLYNQFVVSENNVVKGFIASLSLPVLIKYSINTRRLKPFLNMGSLFNIDLVDKFRIYNTVAFNDVITTETLMDRSGMGMNIGPTIGIGIQYPLKNRTELLFELRYNRTFEIASQNLSGTSEFHIFMGISF